MIKNYLKIAIRNMLKNKGYMFINIIGLAIGIAVCFLIFLWVTDELSYDRFHEKSQRIYRTLWDARFGDNEWTLPFGPVPLAKVLRNEFPEVEQAVRIRPASRTVRQDKEYIVEENVFYVDPTFFDVFTVSFIAGNPETALNDANSVVLTKEKAQRYFPNQNPVGQTLELNDGTLLKVSAVVKRFPPQSHCHFDFLAPLQALPIIERRRTHWGSATVYTYFVLREGEQAAVVERKLHDYVEENVFDRESNPAGNYSRFLVQPLTDIHLRSHFKYELSANGNILYVYLFSVIAVFILVLACINFVNLSTARSAHRAKEVGLRKVLGGQRYQLVGQFLAESLVYVALAVLLGIVLTELALPAFNPLADKQMTTHYLDSPSTLIALTLIALAVAVLAGMYPAFYLSAFWPVRALRGHVTSNTGRDWLRNGLVVTQFCVSIGLLAGTFVVRSQLKYIKNKRLGFDKEHVLVVKDANALGNKSPVFKDRLNSHPLVVAASATQSLPGRTFDSTVFEPEQPANYEQSSLTYAMIDEHYVDALGLEIAEGRNFSRQFATDSSAFLINQSAAQALGWPDPVGKQITMSGVVKGSVIGVVEDFHFESLHHEVKPVLFPFIRWRPSYIAVRLQPGDLADGIAAVQQLWEEFVPQQPFEYSFLDQDYQQIYDKEQRVARIFGTFSALAIFIACLGLFGLAAFTAEQRTKEIGIRKVLGATVTGIVGLLSKDIAKLVLAANLIAWPLAYYGMNKWLQNFAYRTDFDWWIFLLAGGLALAIALLTVSTQAVKAALTNPVESLRYE
ncbi:FtsX-like permease family protein [candidate division KSB1 bacterium]|nr:FtsX-like permease family protein [candidate division KSB1 bacterium]NIR69128.1 FtsX-like permease family protein [candidate division KSB1 bacterium]NIS22659.1 FtsX-like permease family protein [candidate division KSB1 bacterium]NIT69517.1 FtsX-like permease family protein [candidate division KSB1 bacterium]NIU23170.1 FtsX-like permease family protein [candidate division KSB1 bacterium]